MTKDDLVSKDTALKMAYDWVNEYAPPEVVQACKEALEQPAQEPVAWTDKHNLFLEFDKEWLCNQAVCKDNEAIPLYTHPAPSWQGLSDDEMNEIFEQVCGKYSRLNAIDIDFIRAIEQALKEKNT